MQYTEQELSTLIKNLETEFSAHIADVTGAAQPTSLAKAEDEKPAGKKDESKDESAAESKPEAKESKEEKPKDAPAAESKEAAPEAEAAPAAPAEEEAPVAPSADEGASGYDAEDIAHMDQMYMSMSKAELLAHHDSCVRALDAQGAEHIHAAPAAPAAEQAAPAAPAAPAAEIDKCGDMSMSKSEPNAELELAKSEAAAQKAKAEELQKNLTGIQEFLTQLVKKVPQGKAITSLEQVAKSEVSGEEKQLSKSEITAILMKKAAEPTLSKTDRDAINAFYLNQANFNTISHLLK
ncbi:MAG: hypothetical protein HC840_00175 [Leptolyngbyaceae cyanobacterium RM2_2_4]|nr:hypothetical protein [Leptolyngbyaceae cyanobacterium RM2_2_4]